jgi:hypothetical protein
MPVWSWLHRRHCKQLFSRAVLTYPIYNPPHTMAWPRSSIRKAEENYRYFEPHKDERVSGLLEWLKQFGVDGSLTPDGLAAIDIWFHDYAHCLVGHSEFREATALHDLTPSWEGELHHLNVVWDLGLYFGQYICMIKPGAKWELEYGNETMRREQHDGYHQPVIKIARPGSVLPVSPWGDIYYAATIKKSRSWSRFDSHMGTVKALTGMMDIIVN